jgi:hypothetical protein
VEAPGAPSLRFVVTATTSRPGCSPPFVATKPTLGRLARSREYAGVRVGTATPMAISRIPHVGIHVAPTHFRCVR